MSNILNHNRNIFDFKINKSNYWDFHLCVDINDGNTYGVPKVYTFKDKVKVNIYDNLIIDFNSVDI